MQRIQYITAPLIRNIQIISEGIWLYTDSDFISWCLNGYWYMVDLCSLDYEEYRLVKIDQNIFPFKKLYLKYRLQISGQFIQTLICLRLFPGQNIYGKLWCFQKFEPGKRNTCKLTVSYWRHKARNNYLNLYWHSSEGNLTRTAPAIKN